MTDQFTEKVPRDDGPDYPATSARLFSSVPGHSTGLDVQSIFNDELLAHVGDACPDRASVFALADHLRIIAGA